MHLSEFYHILATYINIARFTTMTELNKLKITEALDLLKKREISSTELTKACLEVSKEQNAKLNCYTEITEELALKQASAADENYAKGEARLIDGIPVGVKDLFCMDGFEATSCSKILDGFKPTYESTVSANLQNNGGVVVGRTNMDEFAMGSANITSAKGNVISPWRRKSDDADIVPGGSSGGSSAAISANACFAALGSDTGGSVRQPAAFTGIVGVKPTYGRCSRWGMIAFASSLDQAGVFTRSVEDSALALESMSGHDPKDSTSSNKKVPSFINEMSKISVKGMRIGVPKEYKMDGTPKEIEDNWQKGIDIMKAAGAEIVEISLPHTKYALPTYYIIAPAEASSNLARYDGVRYGFRPDQAPNDIAEFYEAVRAEGFGDEVKRRIMIGTYVLSAGYFDAYYTKAQKVRRRVLNDFEEAFKSVDTIFTPTAPSEAFAIGEKIDDPVKMYLNDIFTVPTSLAGLPAVSVPSGLSENGLPLGLQIIGKHFDESTMFAAARELEKGVNFEYL